MNHRLAAACCLLTFVATANLLANEFVTGIQWDKPPVVDPGKTNASPPSDAVVLFGGAADQQKWINGENWKVEGDVLIAGKGPITSKANFGDCQLHVEWSAPLPVVGDGQGRGNSGIFLMGIYEIQVLDSYNNPTYYDGQAGSIYKQTPPAANAMRKPGEWNTYDIFWTAPKFDDAGKLLSPAYITAVHNGVLILNHFEVKGDTPYTRPPEYNAHPPTGPIMIQDHNNPVRFRNIWVRSFKPVSGDPVRPPSNLIRYGSKPKPADTTPAKKTPAKKAPAKKEAEKPGEVKKTGEKKTDEK